MVLNKRKQNQFNRLFSKLYPWIDVDQSEYYDKQLNDCLDKKSRLISEYEMWDICFECHLNNAAKTDKLNINEVAKLNELLHEMFNNLNNQ